MRESVIWCVVIGVIVVVIGVPCWLAQRGTIETPPHEGIVVDVILPTANSRRHVAHGALIWDDGTKSVVTASVLTGVETGRRYKLTIRRDGWCRLREVRSAKRSS